jgi:hypothetical protein
MLEPSFEHDRHLLKAALLRALRIAAGNPTPEPAVFGRVAEAFDRQNLPEPPEIPGRNELEEIFRDRPPLALVFFETPGLQDYVFKVQSPIDLFGGSSQVADFTRFEASGKTPPLSLFPQLAGPPTSVPVEQVAIFAGAGSGLFLVAANEAERVVAGLEKILAEATAGDLHTRAAALSFWPDELAALPSRSGLEDLFSADPRLASQRGKGASRYAAALASLVGRHQRERSRRQAWPASLSPEQQFTRCEACGGRPAATRRVRGEDVDQLCQPCHNRWKYGIGKRGEEPRSFEELLGGLEPPVGSLAVIYADGANAGELFARVDTPARHRALSRLVEDALDAAAEAVKRKLSEIFLGDNDELRFQTAIKGGDDLVMVVPARGALELAAALIAAFESAIDAAAAGPAFARGPEGLKKALAGFGLGVGVAVGDLHFPIQFLLDYARELLKNAKRLTRPDQGSAPARSAVDFLVLRGGTPLSGSVAELRKRHQEQESQLALHCRPLGGRDLGLFVKATRALKRVPPAQVQAIRREVPRGRQLSLSLWRYQHARSAEWEAWRKALDVPLDQIDGKLWRRAGEKWVTDYLDQVDALDLVVDHGEEISK